MTSKKIRISTCIYGAVLLVFFIFELILAILSNIETVRNIGYFFAVLVNLYAILPVFILLCISKKYENIENEKYEKNSFVNRLISKTSDKNLKIIALFNIFLAVFFLIILQILFGNNFVFPESIKEIIQLVFYYIPWPAFLSVILLAVSYLYSLFENNEDTGKNYSKLKKLTIIYGIAVLLYCIYQIVISYKESEQLLQNNNVEILRLVMFVLFNIYSAFIPTFILLCICKIFDYNGEKEKNLYLAKKEQEPSETDVSEKEISEQDEIEQSFISRILSFITHRKLKTITVINIILILVYDIYATISSTIELLKFGKGIPVSYIIVCLLENLINLLRFPVFYIILLFILTKVFKYLQENEKSEGNDTIKDIS